MEKYLDQAKSFYEFSQTPAGMIVTNILIVFIISEFIGRGLAFRIGEIKKWEMSTRKSVAGIFGYSFNIILGILVAVFFQRDPSISLLLIAGAALLHVLVVEKGTAFTFIKRIFGLGKK